MRSILLFFLSLLIVLPIIAQEENTQGRDPILEAEISGRLNQINPDAVPLFIAATEAMDAERYEEAQRGYNAVLEIAPDFPDALRRLSYVELYLGNIDKAQRLARLAYEIEPNHYNQAALASTLAFSEESNDWREALSLAKEAVAADPDDSYSQQVLLIAAIQNENLPLIRESSESLVRLEPGHPLGHFYLGLIYAERGQWLDSEAELLRAQELGWPEDEVNAALESGISHEISIERLKQNAIWGFGTWIIAMIVLFVIGAILSSLTLAAIKQSQTTGSFRVNPAESLIRNFYRVVIVLATVFFYLSLPIVGLIAVAAVLGIFYFFLLVGRIPVQLMLFIGLAGFASVVAVLRGLYSLFRRQVWQDPGIYLARKDAPEMWQIVEEVAAKVGTRPVDAIYVISNAGIAVMERGNLITKIRDKGERYLLLGLGALSDMPLSQFKAILAHEYGHFSNRDTAGGDFALQVRISMMETARHLAINGQARWYNPVWLFLNLFNRIFLRITLGASRLQEVLADRFAVMAYGTQSFIDGLTHVVRQSLQFDMQVQHEIQSAFKEQRVLSNIYTLPELETTQEKELDAKLAELIAKPTSIYDSHPAVKDRIALAEKLQSTVTDTDRDDIQNVADLLPNLANLQDNMTKRVYDNIRQQQAMMQRIRRQQMQQRRR